VGLLTYWGRTGVPYIGPEVESLHPSDVRWLRGWLNHAGLWRARRFPDPHPSAFRPRTCGFPQMSVDEPHGARSWLIDSAVLEPHLRGCPTKQREEFERRLLALVRSQMDISDRDHPHGWEISDFIVTARIHYAPEPEARLQPSHERHGAQPVRRRRRASGRRRELGRLAQTRRIDRYRCRWSQDARTLCGWFATRSRGSATAPSSSPAS